MFKKAQNILILLCCVLFVAACGEAPKSVGNPKPSVYYWRTTFVLDAAERAFLANNNVGKLYLRLFDVVREPSGELFPSGTLLFKDTVPGGMEVIPVVFIEPGALRDTAGVSELPRLIVRRIDQMLEQNGCAAASEIQLDYDWAQSDRATYFDLLQSVEDALHQEGRKLSVTIRLHQLAQTPPPADYGVLMVYNTGNVRSETEANSILDPEVVGPYLPRLHDYALPLCAALPLYSWDLLFHTGNFRQIVKGVDVQDTSLFEPIDSVHYRCRRFMAIPNSGISDNESNRIFPGDEIRHEWASFATLQKVKRMLEDHRSGICDQIVLYHLDNKSFNQYNNNEIKDLFVKP